MYPPDLNFTAGLLYVSTDNKAESNALSKHNLTFEGNPLLITYFTKTMHNQKNNKWIGCKNPIANFHHPNLHKAHIDE